MPPLLQSPAAGNKTYRLLCWSLSQRIGKESSKWLRESLTHAEESSNMLGKTMPIFNTDLQHHEFMSWFSILMLMYFMLLLLFFGGAVVLTRDLLPQASSCWCVPSGLRSWHCQPSTACCQTTGSLKGERMGAKAQLAWARFNTAFGGL